MERYVGTVVRGLRAPIIREGDDIETIVVDTVCQASEAGEFQIKPRDVIAVTEAVVARAQGNYATVDQIGKDVKEALCGGTIGVIFPILSRNRFAICLKGISKGADKIVLMLNYPSDEVGNHLVNIEALDEKNINPYHDTLTQAEFEENFGKAKHTFTGVDYINYYKEIIESQGTEVEIIFSNKPEAILKYTKKVLTCDIHTRERTKKLLKAAGAEKVIGLDNILNTPNDSGYNEEYGILGANKANEDMVKLFPRGSTQLVKNIQKRIEEKSGIKVEVMIYGDGAFKDPVGKIWELADPVVSPGYTPGLEGTPNEVKLKYLADNDFAHLKGEELKKAVSKYIKGKSDNLVGDMVSQGTTPRRLTDLLGSLSDLTSGSGDKGTPIIYIQGYFDNFAE